MRISCFLSDFDLKFYRAIKVSIETKLEEILRLLKNDDLLALPLTRTICVEWKSSEWYNV